MLGLLPVLLVVLAGACGALATYLAVERAPLRLRLCGGAVAGMALLAWSGFLLSLLAGLNWVSVSAVTALLLAALLALRPRARRLAEEWRAAKFRAADYITFGLWAAFFSWLFSRVVMIESDGLHTAPANNYGDLPFHFGVITSFAYGENIPPESPIYAGLRFTYPFLIDFLTAFFHRAGAPWALAFFLTNIVLALAFVGLIEAMTFELTGSRLAARLAPPLFIFNGGFGFVYALRDFLNSGDSLWHFLARLPRTYTMSDELHLRWGNVVTTLLVPQRSLLFGLPVAAMVVLLWWRALNEETTRETKRRMLVAAGVLAGLLPLMHAHGFLSLMVAGGLLALIFFSWDWLWFFVPAGALAAPQAAWLSGTGVKGSLFKWHPGWEAQGVSPLWFWVINAGAFLALLAAALLIKKLTSGRLLRFYVAFVPLFLIPNFVLLAPWAWDNIKMLVYWYLVSCALVAHLLAWLFARRVWLVSVAAALLLVTLTLSGALDVGRGLSPVENTTLYGRAELEVAEMIRQRTPPRARILHAPIHNSLVTLTGRQPFMGYPGHLWTHGIDYQQREQQIGVIYGSPRQAESLIAQNAIDYVVVGPAERERFFGGGDEQAVFADYPVVVDHAGYRVYQVRPAT
jgi:hypothetical protein